MTTLSEVPVHLISLKAQTSPTSKELSRANFVQPEENFTLDFFIIMYLTDQVLPSETERDVLLLSVLKCLLIKLNGILCMGKQKIIFFKNHDL